MTFDEYVSIYLPQYAEFADVVRAILKKAIEAAHGVPRPQSTQSRAKAPDKLKSRLVEAGAVDSPNVEAERKDLAGVRLIFYTNTDVERFLNARLLFENFDVDYQETKIHHPAKENEGVRYRAIHYTVRLNEERTKLPEYKKFSGMRCEVQIQTVLNHAWSETTHDIAYKNEPRAGFGLKATEGIKKRINDIMDKYLLPAGYEFQRVQHDYERLQQGKDLFDRDAIASLEAAKNNNERYDLLVALKNYVPDYDDLPAVYGDLRGPLIAAVRAARPTPREPIDATFGRLEGKTAADVARMAVEIFDMLRYVDIEGTIGALCDVFRDEGDEEVRKQILESVKRLAEYNLDAWKQVGPQIQMFLADYIDSLPAEDWPTLRPVMIVVWREILESDITGTTWRAESMTLHSGVVPVSAELKAIRSKAIDGLFKLFAASSTDGEKRSITSALDAATRVPNQASYSNELLALSLMDAKRIVDFLTDKASSSGYELLEHLEHQFLYDYRRARGIASHADDPFGCRSVAEDLMRAIEAFRDAINADSRFVAYKTLVGFESTFPGHWIDDDFDYNDSEKYRAEKAEAFVAEISPQNQDDWLAFVERCAATKSDDLATFPVFGQFLVRLAREKPDVAECYIQRGTKDLLRFLPGLLDGLSQSGQAEIYERVVASLLDGKKDLIALARHWRNSKPNKPALIKQVLDDAIAAEDTIAVIECVAFAIEQAGTDLVPADDNFLVPAVSYLTAHDDARWVRAVWFIRASIFFDQLNAANASLLLSNLVALPKLSHESERILSLIAQNHLEAVWRYFGDRLAHEARKDNGEQYQAVPFEFYDLQKQLSRDPKLAAKYGRVWYAGGNELFRWRGGRLLSAAFPHCPEDFAKALLDEIATGDESAADFALEILQNYRGEPTTHDVLKEIVARYPDDERKMARVEISFDNTGVVGGEFGMVEALRAKKVLMQTWKDDPREAVREFAEKHIRSLDLRIIAEQKRADEGGEMRRRRFGGGDGDGEE